MVMGVSGLKICTQRAKPSRWPEQTLTKVETFLYFFLHFLIFYMTNIMAIHHPFSTISIKKYIHYVSLIMNNTQGYVTK